MKSRGRFSIAAPVIVLLGMIVSPAVAGSKPTSEERVLDTPVTVPSIKGGDAIELFENLMLDMNAQLPLPINIEILKANGSQKIVTENLDITGGKYKYSELLAKFRKVLPGLSWNVNGNSFDITIEVDNQIADPLNRKINKEHNLNLSTPDWILLFSNEFTDFPIAVAFGADEGATKKYKVDLKPGMTIRQALDEVGKAAGATWIASFYAEKQPGIRGDISYIKNNYVVDSDNEIIKRD